MSRTKGRVSTLRANLKVLVALTIGILIGVAGVGVGAFASFDHPFFKPLSMRTGADCGPHAYVTNLNAGNRQEGDRPSIKLYGAPTVVPGSRTSTGVTLLIGGKRANPNIVRCYGKWAVYTDTGTAGYKLGPLHRFKVGAVRGSVKVRIRPGQGGVIYAIYGRRKR